MQFRWQSAALLGLAEKNPTHTEKILRVGGLFSGIGGFEEGLHQAGHIPAFWCEFEPAAQAVLRAQFPQVPHSGDVRTLSALPPGIDLLTAGFPCQDLSSAGQTAGITGARSGLVMEIFRLLDVTPVPHVLLENVPFMLSLGRGAAMALVVRELEQRGYRWAYRVVDTHAFGIPQRRERLFLLASRELDPRRVLFGEDAGPPAPPSKHAVGKVACGFYWTMGQAGLGWAVDAVPPLIGGSGWGIPSPPAILLPSLDVVTLSIQDAERLQGFPAEWTRPAEAVAKPRTRWKLVGNAVTVEVARWIGERLRHPSASVPPLQEQPLHPGETWPRAAYNVGGGTFAVRLSAWPVGFASPPLTTFLQYPTPLLSARATAVFLTRAGRGTLVFPEGFLEAMRAHEKRMRRDARR